MKAFSADTFLIGAALERLGTAQAQALLDQIHRGCDSTATTSVSPQASAGAAESAFTILLKTGVIDANRGNHK